MATDCGYPDCGVCGLSIKEHEAALGLRCQQCHADFKDAWRESPSHAGLCRACASVVGSHRPGVGKWGKPA